MLLINYNLIDKENIKTNNIEFKDLVQTLMESNIVGLDNNLEWLIKNCFITKETTSDIVLVLLSQKKSDADIKKR